MKFTESKTLKSVIGSEALRLEELAAFKAEQRQYHQAAKLMDQVIHLKNMLLMFDRVLPGFSSIAMGEVSEALFDREFREIEI
jgi:hypothetical protein